MKHSERRIEPDDGVQCVWVSQLNGFLDLPADNLDNQVLLVTGSALFRARCGRRWHGDRIHEGKPLDSHHWIGWRTENHCFCMCLPQPAWSPCRKNPWNQFLKPPVTFVWCRCEKPAACVLCQSLSELGAPGAIRDDFPLIFIYIYILVTPKKIEQIQFTNI